ncbi:head GIN domain-containing protein [Robiginitalea sediminis]|uniref:head GIN domain-containing protein n=1 Tax=Robiginitalea sediminis TaxID=1982593 RepID=UPI000B4B91CC|nr:head GIN domain-containing protein [Robiginitalea sediminis]
MKRISITLLLALLVSTTAGAQWGKTVKGNGKTTTETREVGTYDEIEVSHIFSVTLVDGREGTLTLEGEDNLLDYVITEVKGDRLVISVKKGYQLKVSSAGRNGIRVTVPVQDLREAHASGASDLTGKVRLKSDTFRASISGAADMSLELETGELRADISGAATLILSGTAQSVRISGSGASDLRGYDLTAREVEANLSGSSDVQITATEALTARVSGASDLRYKGNPTRVDSKASGAANVKKS